MADIIRHFLLAFHRLFNTNIAYFISGPACSFDIFLNAIEHEQVEKIVDFEIYNLLKLGSVGSICDRTGGEFESNWDKVDSGYSEKKLKSQLCGKDKNSMYPSVSLYTQGVSDYRFYTQVECQHLFDKLTRHSEYLNWNDEFCYQKEKNGQVDKYGLVLVVLLHCPPHLHNSLNFTPPFVEKRQVDFHTELSPDQRRHISKLGGHKTEKVLLTLGPYVDNQVLDWRLFCYYLKIGIQLTKITKVIEFKVSYYARNFFSKMAAIRGKATSPVMREIVKSLMCHVFGKTLSNGEKYDNCKIIDNEK